MDETPLQRRIDVRNTVQTVPDNQPAPRWEDDQTEGDDRSPAPAVRSVVKELLETAVFILLVFLIVRGVVQNFKIEGQSMEPSLQTGQYILVNKIVYFHFDLNAPVRLLPGRGDTPARVVYPFTMPHRGDVVVFEYPRDISKDYIKRVIGLPGETVTIHDGQVYINGVLLDEPYLEGRQTSCRSDDPCGESKPFVVPPGSVFVLGDNRPNSSDSREWAELPLDRIIGKAWVSYWPQQNWGVISTPSYAAQP
ncbi:MAG: signal peptidase I [Roseiflexaceae bacterium]